MEAIHTTFKKVPDTLGIVIVGCSVETKELLDEWIVGITDSLIEADVIPKESKPEDVWEQILVTTSTGGRNDLIFVCKKDAKFHIGKFAMARLSFPDCSWIEDWLVNYAKHYACAPRGTHAEAYNASNENDDE